MRGSNPDPRLAPSRSEVCSPKNWKGNRENLLLRLDKPILGSGDVTVSQAVHASKVSDAKVKLMSFVVNVGYDEAEHIYYVISSNIPGLHIEASTFEEFVECAEDFTPDLVGNNAAGAKIMFEREVVLA